MKLLCEEGIPTVVITARNWVMDQYIRLRCPKMPEPRFHEGLSVKGHLDHKVPMGPFFLPSLHDLSETYRCYYDKITPELLERIGNRIAGFRGFVVREEWKARFVLEFFYGHGELYVIFLHVGESEQLVRVRSTLDTRQRRNYESRGPSLYLAVVRKLLRQLEDVAYGERSAPQRRERGMTTKSLAREALRRLGDGYPSDSAIVAETIRGELRERPPTDLEEAESRINELLASEFFEKPAIEIFRFEGGPQKWSVRLKYPSGGEVHAHQDSWK